jgi:hypothetical protein
MLAKILSEINQKTMQITKEVRGKDMVMQI